MGDSIQTHQIAAPGSKIDPAQIFRRGKFAGHSFQADIIAFTVAGFIIIFGHIITADNRIDRHRNIHRRKIQISHPNPIDNQFNLRQIELEIKVNPTETRQVCHFLIKLVRQFGYLFQFRPGQTKLQRLAPAAADK